MTLDFNSTQDGRYRLGRLVLGPVFAAFAHLLLKEAGENGVGQLAFVARDGDLLMRVTECLAAGTARYSAPECSYLYLSRISTALPGQVDFQQGALPEFFSIRAGGYTPRGFLTYFGLDPDKYLPHLARHGLAPETPINLPDELAPLVRDPDFLLIVAGDRQRQIELLGAYLRQERILDNPHCALVDIGWRGSISTSLAHAFRRDGLGPPEICFLLGYWNEFDAAPTGNRIQGVLTDQQRGRSILEGAAHYLAMPLEAISRAEHGTVLGYRRNSEGMVVPILSAALPQRCAEEQDHECREQIRHGILDFVKHDAVNYLASNRDSGRLRRDAQKRMIRLAFFPGMEEIRAVKHLAHTEGHVGSWHALMLDQDRPSPYKNPRRWLAGLASPWRGAYIAATGRFPASVLYFLSEAVLAAYPNCKRRLRSATLRLSRR